MAKRLQHRGGTTAQHSTFTGAVREVTVDTDKNTLVVHDGATAGGKPLPTLTGAETLTNKTLSSPTFSGTATNFTSTGIDDNATSTAITIDSSERVGIGTASPTSPLMVQTNDYTPIHVKGANPKTILVETTDGETGISLIKLKNSAHEYNIENGRRANTLTFYGNPGGERMCIDSSGNVGIGTSSPAGNLHVAGSEIFFKNDAGNCTVSIGASDSGNSVINLGDPSDGDVGRILYNHANNSLSFKVNASERMRIDGSGNVGIGTTSPTQALSIASISSTPGDYKGLAFQSGGTEVSYVRSNCTDGNNYFLTFGTFASGLAERMRIDSSGNVMTGTTNSAPAQDNVAGVSLRATNPSEFSQGGKQAVNLNRAANDGAIVSLRGDGTEVATLQVRSDFGIFQFGSLGTGIGGTSSHAWLPTSGNARVDNTISVGQASYRMTVVYATTGTINTSDQNEKQSIQSLTTAEMNVGKRLSSLIKTYKWNSSVEEKGDNARTHTGIIAQDVQQAFADEGLDATKYGLWCSDTWSIDADGETIENPEEITENNPTKTKLGIRYEQLLSFIQAYNDQRFTELEARITTLEANNP